MASIEKTVFISYRRDDSYEALAVYQYLTNQQYDVFLDYASIRSGDFEQIIVSNIRARAHFIIILTPTALDRCSEPGDWLRREIETAIDEKRNIIPLFFNGFSFSSPPVVKNLTGKLAALRRYNGLNIPPGFFNEAMARLSSQYLNVPLDAVLLPVSTEVQRTVEEKQNAANQALEEKKENIEQVIHAATEMPAKQDMDEKVPAPTVEKSREKEKRLNYRMYGIAAVILVLVLVGITGIRSMIQNNRPDPTPTATLTQNPTQTLEPTKTKTIPDLPGGTETTPTTTPVLPTQTATVTPTATLGVGSTMTSDKDGMTLLFVPAGEFTRGNNDSRESDEKPALPVYLDAFWIDKTEITNAMYRGCVNDGKCNAPSPKKSETRSSYYASRQFDTFPVINVTWQDANDYCAWVGRRLPTEAEWEKAASWDEKNQKKLLYPWGDTISCSVANYKGETADCKDDTTKVGSYESGASPYGVLDMAGNVWEWVFDNYDPAFYDDPGTERNPKQTIANSDFRVARGGAWSATGEQLHTANRYRVNEFSQLNDLGFRCVLPVSTPPP